MKKQIASNPTSRTPRTHNPVHINGWTLPHKTLERAKWMLALLLSLMFISSYGQSYTPIDYHFQDAPFETKDKLQSEGIPSFDKKIISMAANGYGQWAVMGDGGSSYWALLSNASYDENAVSNPNIPSGVVQYGNFSGIYGNNVKVATNLNGSVRYVWFDEVNQRFIIEGFNDQSFLSSNVNEKQIDNSVLNIPKPELQRKVIRKPIFTYTPVNAFINVDSTNKGDRNWRDHFDIAMDKKYLYIVWETVDLTTTPKSFQINTVTINLTNDLLTYRKFIAQNGYRPTIACNIRANPNLPTYDIAWISVSKTLKDIWTGEGFSVNHSLVLNNGIVVTRNVPSWVNKPLNPISSFSASNIINHANYSPHTLHARMLVSSETGSEYNARAIYVLTSVDVLGDPEHDPENLEYTADLILHKFDNPSNQWLDATYVDGYLLNKPRGVPINDNLFYRVCNNPLNAFVNPYDGEASSSFNEWHCMYQLRNNKDNTPYGDAFPLLIVRDDDNGIMNNVDPDMRTILSRKKLGSGAWVSVQAPQWNQGGGPDHVGAANQMGVHTRWFADNITNQGNSAYKTFYNRDLRAFDEAIEENTLVTHLCKVADGSSHLGTVGATLQGGKSLTLWTDPTFNVSLDGAGTNSGIYLPDPLNPYHHNAKLTLSGDGVNLSIGQGVAGPSAYMNTFPNFKLIFSGDNQKLIVNRGSFINYTGYVYDQQYDGYFYGNWNSYSQFEGTGAIEFKGGGRTEDVHDATAPPTALIAPATLNILGGANFRLPETISFTAENSRINLYYSQNITPVYENATHTLNPNATGKGYFQGPVTLNWCEVLSAIPSGQTKNVFFVKSCIDGSCTALQGLTTLNCLFENVVSGGEARLRMDGHAVNGYYAKQCSIKYGLFNSFEVNIFRPVRYISIDGSNFDNMKTYGIYIKRNGTSGEVTYSNVSITDNWFWTYLANNCRGIVIENFNETSSSNPSGEFQKVWLEGNDFSTGTSLSGSERVSAAIHLINSTATILRNTITGAGYANGIIVEGPTGTSTLGLNSFICRNIIANCNTVSGDGRGLSTQGWNGISKLNNISYCDIGHLSGENDDGAIAFSKYHHNTITGLKMYNTLTIPNILNLDGNHSSPNDYAFFDTIYNNNTSSSGTSGQIEVDKAGFFTSAPELILGTASNDPDIYGTYGHNNIISNAASDNLIYSHFANYTIPKINLNYWAWGTLSSSSVVGLSSGNWGTYMINVDYPTTDPVSSLNMLSAPFTVSCGTGFDAFAKGSNEQPQSSFNLSNQDCLSLYDKGYYLQQNGESQKAYDTLKKYVEQCANEKNSNGYGEVAFGSLNSANAHRSDDLNRFIEFREWLKSVLYLNEQPGIPGIRYYCGDVYLILGTFYYNPPIGTDVKAQMAILKFVHDSGQCKEAFPEFDKEYNELRQRLISLYRDSVLDTIATPLDTTLPNINDLGLSILRGKQNGVTSPTHKTSVNLSFLRAEENPFTNEVALVYELSDASLVRVEVYDVLGNSVYGNGGGLQQAGEHHLPIDGSHWSKGTYYARLITLSGEVKTVKLIKK